MLKNRSAGVIFEEDFHYLDHLAPLCSLLAIPLLVTEESLYKLGKKYYPNLSIFLVDFGQIGEILTQNFQKIYYCFSSDFLDQSLGIYQFFVPKKWEKIWCPHGYSEKDNYDGFVNEKKILCYGSEMKKRLRKKKFSSYSHFIGNYRAHFFCKHLSFYRKLMQKKLSTFREKPTLLYSPTWEEGENHFRFSDLDSFCSHLCPDFNWILKLHPNTLKTHLAKYEYLKAKHQNSYVFFLENFPLIYPLLDQIEGFIGDGSSIGYDMLFFPEKPLFFYTENTLKLHQMGVKITNKELLHFSSFWKKHRKPSKALQTLKQKYYFSIFT